jgi:hypothetical protein
VACLICTDVAEIPVLPYQVINIGLDFLNIGIQRIGVASAPVQLIANSPTDTQIQISVEYSVG